MRLEPGARLGSYEIVSSLGVGGMGEVYRAKDLDLGREVAIKVLRKELASEPDGLKRFEREARTASALNHPNIITIYHIGEHKGARYIAMELVEGQTLRALLSESALSARKTLDLATQIAGGLAKAHAAGIVHRDLKPENLMVTDDGLVIILDFGLAKLIPQGSEVDAEMATVTKATRQGTILGTVQYMSPEQAAGRAVDYRSDQFSFGSILYELLTGRLAFREDTVPQTLTAIMKDEPEPISKLNDHAPDQLLAIVERCLAKEPDKRYDETKELVTELQSVPDTMSLSRRTRRRVLWMAAAALGTILVSALGLNVLGLRDWVSSNFTPAPIESIAVLPLQNLSGDPEQEYFADGMTEALITDLAKIGALKVISRSSIMRYKGSDKPLGEIAAELNVDAIVEGSALRVGDRVRITAQLIDPATNQALWADRYERDLQDVLLLQSEVAQAIAKQIQVAVTAEETTHLASARPVNTEAYESYLKGMFFLNQYTPEGFEKGLAYLEDAIEKDPADPLAYAGLAIGYGELSHLPVPPQIALPRAKAFALEALKRDASQAEAHLALAEVKIYYEWDLEGAAQAFQRTLELDANSARAQSHYGFYLAATGHFDEALTRLKRASELDPLAPAYSAQYGQLLIGAGQYDEAIDAAQKSLELNPEFPMGLAMLGLAYAKKGMYEEAIAAHEKAGPERWRLGVTYALAGRRDEARQLVAELEQAGQNTWGLAEIYAALGEKDEAFRWLEASYESRHPLMPWVSALTGVSSSASSKIEHVFKVLRDDPRLQDLLRRVNLPP